MMMPSSDSIEIVILKVNVRFFDTFKKQTEMTFNDKNFVNINLKVKDVNG